MLRDFILTNRQELIVRCRVKVARRRAPRATVFELEHGIPTFIEQLADLLPRAGSDASPAANDDSIAQEARTHGSELLGAHFSIEQVVHDYGDLCQAIMDLAVERGKSIAPAEFAILNMNLDTAIASAVSAYVRDREAELSRDTAQAANERLGIFGHEMLNFLNTAVLAIAAMKAGTVGFGGATAAALDRSLLSMRRLVDSALAQVRLESPAGLPREPIDVGSFVAEVQVAASLEARSKGCELSVEPVPPRLCVWGDRQVLAGVLANLLQNAFKFTKAQGHVRLRTEARDGRVRIDIEDECGGLPDGPVEALFRPFEQRGADKSGLGLGLAICRRGVQANGGTLSARSLPGKGCVFTMELEEADPPPARAPHPSHGDRNSRLAMNG